MGNKLFRSPSNLVISDSCSIECTSTMNTYIENSIEAPDECSSFNYEPEGIPAHDKKILYSLGYDIKEEIGRGAYASVYIAEYNHLISEVLDGQGNPVVEKPGDRFACKYVNIRSLTSTVSKGKNG